MAKIDIHPLNDKVLVESLELGEQTRGGIVIPDSAKEKPQEALVIAVGPGKRDEKGHRIQMEIKAGDRIIISKYGGTEVKYAGHKYKLLDADDVLAVLD